MRIIDESKIPAFMLSPRYRRNFFRFVRVLLIFLMLIGIVMFCAATWYYFFASRHQIASPEDVFYDPLHKKILVLTGFVSGNLAMFATFREIGKKIRKLDEQMGAQPGNQH